MRAVFGDTGNTPIHGLLVGRGSVEGVPGMNIVTRCNLQFAHEQGVCGASLPGSLTMVTVSMIRMVLEC